MTFDELNDIIRNSENSIVNLISTFAPWLAPLAPAFMTYQHAIDPDTLNFPIPIALPVALVVEILGFSAVSTFMSFWFYNRRHRAETKKAPLTLIIVAFAFYLALILFSNVLLDAFGNELWTLVTVRALYTLQTIPAALIVAVRTQHRDMIAEITKEQNEKNANKTTQTQSSPIPQNAPQQPKLKKSELAYLFISNYYSQNKSLPKAKAVVDGSGVSLGSASDAKMRFIVSNEDELLNNGIVTQDDIIAAHSRLGQTMNKESNLSVNDLIQEFINSNGKFPTSTDLSNINVSLDDTVKFVVENQDTIRSQGLLTEDVIQQAIERYNQ